MKETLFGRNGKALIACAIVAVIGLGAWIAMMTCGLLTTTDMSNIFDWGLLIAVFAFLVGFGAGGQFVASCIVLARAGSLMPYATIMQGVAVAGGVGAGVAIVADLGNPLHMLALLAHPNPASPLTWDMIALTVFIAVAVIGWVALARDWKSKRAWMAVGLVAALALQVVEGCLFALQSARAWWHSITMPLDFIVVAFVCGLALAVIVSAASKLEGALAAARRFASMLFVFVVAHVALSLIEVCGLVLEPTGGAAMALTLIGRYIVLYAVELVVPLAAVIVLKARQAQGDRAAHDEDLGPSVRTYIWCGALVVIGMFAHRLMLLYPAFGGSTLFTALSNQASPSWAYPVSTGFLASTKETWALTQAYFPAPVECLSALLPIGLAALIALLACNVAFAWRTDREQG